MFSILRHESLPNVTSHYYYPAEKVVISKKTGFAEIFFFMPGDNSGGSQHIDIFNSANPEKVRRMP